MNANELADAMEIRASIRRKATSRKSVTEGANDRLADQLDQAATMLRQQEVEIERITSKYEEMLTVKELTDDKIADLIKATNDEIGMKNIRTFDFTKVLLRKAQEK